MKKRSAGGFDRTDLDRLIEEITVDAYGEEEQLWAFRQAFEDKVDVPCEGSVIGEPVTVIGFDYDGNERRGLTAKCRRQDGAEYVVAAADVLLPPGTVGARYLAAYRKWIGLAPASSSSAGAIAMVVLSVGRNTARCRLLGSDKSVTLRDNRNWDLVPGEIATVRVHKQWTYAGTCLSGEIESRRLDAVALGLVPLRLEERGPWDPAQEYWGDEGVPIEKWAKAIIRRGPRPGYEMEQVLPGLDLEDPFSDSIGKAVDCRDSGDMPEARRMLMDLCQTDLRCLDAHAHLGIFLFDARPADAIRHYEVGVRIAELSFPRGFDGVLSWGWIDNRPFLRCLHGYGLCLWRLGRFEEAQRVFDRMLWLNPGDNQGVRFLIDDVRAKVRWENCSSR